MVLGSSVTVTSKLIAASVEPNNRSNNSKSLDRIWEQILGPLRIKEMGGMRWIVQTDMNLLYMTLHLNWKSWEIKKVIKTSVKYTLQNSQIKFGKIWMLRSDNFDTTHEMKQIRSIKKQTKQILLWKKMIFSEGTIESFHKAGMYFFAY